MARFGVVDKTSRERNAGCQVRIGYAWNPYAHRRK
jgi:hypothetical protein